MVQREVWCTQTPKSRLVCVQSMSSAVHSSRPDSTPFCKHVRKVRHAAVGLTCAVAGFASTPAGAGEAESGCPECYPPLPTGAPAAGLLPRPVLQAAGSQVDADLHEGSQAADGPRRCAIRA